MTAERPPRTDDNGAAFEGKSYPDEMLKGSPATAKPGFTDDKRSPTTEHEWEQAVASADKTLGLEGVAVPRAAHVTLPGGSHEELTASSAKAS